MNKQRAKSVEVRLIYIKFHKLLSRLLQFPVYM